MSIAFLLVPSTPLTQRLTLPVRHASGLSSYHHPGVPATTEAAEANVRGVVVVSDVRGHTHMTGERTEENNNDGIPSTTITTSITMYHADRVSEQQHRNVRLLQQQQQQKRSIESNSYSNKELSSSPFPMTTLMATSTAIATVTTTSTATATRTRQGVANRLWHETEHHNSHGNVHNDDDDNNYINNIDNYITMRNMTSTTTS